MEPFVRGDKPSCLSDGVEVAGWTAAWVSGTEETKWDWHGIQPALADAASANTDDHCSYCDVHLPDPRTVDHLRPKSRSRFPALAYEWTNLYLCCYGCQPRVGQYSTDVIAPDEFGYRFEDFFFIDSEWNIRALSGPNEARAAKTIEHLRLNKEGRSLSLKRQRSYAEQGAVRERKVRDYRYLWPT
jgi:uncharacterized protein (TIGR02646 family)